DLQAVFIAGEAPQAARLIAEVRHRRLNLAILGSDALGVPDFLSLGGDAVEGTIIPTPFSPHDARAGVRRFVDSFKRRYGVAPDMSAALAYDAVRVLAHAIDAAATTSPDRIAEALHATRGWSGVTCEFTFGPDGDLVGRPIATMVVRNHRF